MDAGRLKIYLGYAVGVGKTYKMLIEAHELLNKEVDVVIGYIEPHWHETFEKAKGIEIIPAKRIQYRGINLREADVEAIIARKPLVALIDEIAHTNAPNSENLKRYQDVLEFLKNGINVNATLNIQHIESIAPEVEQNLGIRVLERVPDEIIIGADSIVNIDITVKKLISRIKDGKLYIRPEAINTALNNFFTAGNLNCLRELTQKWLQNNKK